MIVSNWGLTYQRRSKKNDKSGQTFVSKFSYLTVFSFFTQSIPREYNIMTPSLGLRCTDCKRKKREDFRDNNNSFTYNEVICCLTKINIIQYVCVKLLFVYTVSTSWRQRQTLCVKDDIRVPHLYRVAIFLKHISLFSLLMSVDAV